MRSAGTSITPQAISTSMVRSTSRATCSLVSRYGPPEMCASTAWSTAPTSSRAKTC